MKSTGRSDSLLQKAKECYITGGTRGLEAHHLFPGSRRQASDQWGLWIWLRHDWHTGTPYAVHSDPALLRRFQQEGQQAFEAKYGREKWMEIMGKNYLEES